MVSHSDERAFKQTEMVFRSHLITNIEWNKNKPMTSPQIAVRLNRKGDKLRLQAKWANDIMWATVWLDWPAKVEDIKDAAKQMADGLVDRFGDMGESE